jgi:UrcA family protein
MCAVITASAFAASGVGSPAYGKGRPILVNAPPEDAVVRRVNYADLNLAQPSGQQALVSRVKFAVNDMCSTISNSYETAFKTIESRCTNASWDQARPQIDSAVMRAREIAQAGHSAILATALTITVPVEK